MSTLRGERIRIHTRSPHSIAATLRQRLSPAKLAQLVAILTSLEPDEPPTCSAWSRSAGRTCGQPLPAGAVKCYSHGGQSPQARLAAAARVAVAEAAAARPHRTSREILLHVQHGMDVAMLDAEERAVIGTATLEALTERERARVSAAQIAAKIRDLGIEEAERKVQDEQLQTIAGWLREAVAIPHLTDRQQKSILRRWAALARDQRPEPVDWSEPAPVVLAPASSSLGPGPVDIEPVILAEEPARAARPAIVEESELVEERPLRALAFVGRAIVSRCPGCGEAVDHGHDQVCGWSTVSARAGRGAW